MRVSSIRNRRKKAREGRSVCSTVLCVLWYNNNPLVAATVVVIAVVVCPPNGTRPGILRPQREREKGKGVNVMVKALVRGGERWRNTPHV